MDETIKELLDWLKGEKYIIPFDRMTSEEERAYLYQISRNRMIDKTIGKINELYK